MTTKLKILAFLTPAMIVLDQLSKLLTVRWLRYSGPRLEPSTWSALESLGHDKANPTEWSLIPGFLSFIHAQNPGAAMGMLVDFEHRMYVFAAFTLVAFVLLGAMWRALPDDDRFQSTTVALILAGAVGNAIDRVHKQTVTDFIRFYTEYTPAVELLRRWDLPNEYPTFNIADSCIVVGVSMYLVFYLFFERDAPARDPAAVGDSPLDSADPPRV
jgi:signal peptidase II